MDFFQFASYAEFFVTLSMDANGDVPNRLWICLLVGGLCFLIVYVFQVVGLMTIAKREGYKNRWQIFIPFFNTYYIGVCSQKNKVYNVNARKFAIATAVLELVMVIGYILYYVAAFAVWEYINWTPYSTSSGEILYYYANGFVETMPASMHWLGWIFMYFNDFVLSILEIVFIVFKLLLLMAFFRTYSARQYMLFSVVAAILPLQGILIYAVRNNKGMNYMDYLKKVRERNYRMYQQQYGNPYNQNPYSGGYNGGYDNGYNNGYYGQNGQGNAQGSSAPDPFDEYGSSSGNSNANPYNGGNSQNGSGGNNSQGGSSDGGSPFDEFN